MIDKDYFIKQHDDYMAKSLTDDEIEQLRFKHLGVESYDEGEYGYAHIIVGYKAFAREIEELVKVKNNI